MRYLSKSFTNSHLEGFQVEFQEKVAQKGLELERK